MRRSGSIILVLTIVVMIVLVALPGCKEKTEGDTGNGATDTTGKPQLLMFTQEGCPPCVPVHETVKELEKEMSGEVVFSVIHAENDFETFNKYKVQATPTITILDGSGNVVKMFVGGTDKGTIESELKRLL